MDKEREVGHNKMAVVAIDFGTTYSGYAFSLTSEYMKDPLKISANTTWIAGTAGLMSFKAPTCILFDEDKQFKHFGYEAEDAYSTLALEQKHHDHYFFRKFKMTLHRHPNLNRDTIIEDETGKSMKAKDVFAGGIMFLKNEALKLLKTRGHELDDWEVLWVLTVPAIWTDGAKQFMREAAQKAEIMNDQLVIALEPEAASVFCRHIPDAKGTDIMNPGAKYMVIDLGGGTADITVHQVGNDGRLRELHKASGGAWGGTKVDDCFVQLLTDIVGEKVMAAFFRDHASDYMDMRREFEVKKRKVKEDMGAIYIKYPLNLKEKYESMSNNTFAKCVATSMYGDQISIVSDKIKFSPDIMKGLFADALTHLEDHIRDIMEKPSARGTTTFLMVGGFAESPIIQETIKRKFPKIKTIVPLESGLAVLKGAVIFGHQPKAIGARVAKFTFGVAISKPFVDGCHPKEKKKVTQNGIVCTDVFHKYVELGDSVDVDDAQSIPFISARGSTMNRIRIYKSTEADPIYVTDEGCSLLGEIIMSASEVDLNQSQTVDVSMTFGGTEITVEARNRNDKEGSYKAKFDFLNN